MTDMRELVRESKIDAIVVALTKRDTKTTYVPEKSGRRSPTTGLSTYYGAIYPAIYTPGYMETEKQAQVEVNFTRQRSPTAN
jgi:hypothetical protein